MIVENIPDEFKKALPILEKIREAGFEAYFVGGSVRDTLLGLPIHDVDIASSAYPEEIKQIFSKTVDTGVEHGTVMVLDHGTGYEITTFRTESTYQDYRRPDKVEFVRSLEEDLKRRDLTINALAMDDKGKIIDLFDGLKDLKNGIIRAVGNPEERFHEDALRMMRAVRFGSQLDFKVELDTFNAIKKNSHLLEKIAIERIHVEWVKLLLGKNPKQGLQEFLDTELYKYCPLFADKYAELKSILEFSDFKLNTEEECWILLSDVFKLKDTDISNLLRSWKSSNNIIKYVIAASLCVQKIKDSKLDIETYYQNGIEIILTANQIAKIRGFGMDDNELKINYDKLPIKSRKEMKINGKDLVQEAGVKPGKIMGEILNKLEKEIVFGNIINDKEILIENAKKLLEEKV